MPLIDLSADIQTNGQVTDPVKVTSAFTTIQAAMNGLENVNFVGGAAIEVTKLALGGGTNTWLRADGAWTSPGANTVYSGRNATVEVVNTTQGVDLFAGTMSIAAKALGANGTMELVAGGSYLNNTGSSHQLIMEFALGTTTVWKATSPAYSAGSDQRSWVLFVVLQALGTTANQRTSGLLTVGDNTAATTGMGVLRGAGGSATATGGPWLGIATTRPMTSAQDVILRASHDQANGSLSIKCEYAWMTITN